jgi:hypothetical protein
MTSFYLQTLSNFLVEYGWGGREVDVLRSVLLLRPLPNSAQRSKVRLSVAERCRLVEKSGAH